MRLHVCYRGEALILSENTNILVDNIYLVYYYYLIDFAIVRFIDPILVMILEGLECYPIL
jgi:hypothetical protein